MHRAVIRFVMGLAALAAPATLSAEEIPFFAGDVWSVTQQLPASEDFEDGAKPQCLFGTRTWPQRGLNFVYVLTSHDYIEPWLQVYSENWELPVGKKTMVDLVTVGGTLGFELTAGSVNYLTGSIDPKVIGEKNNFALNVALGYMLDSRRAGISMRVKFAGSEPEWFIPPMSRLETYEVKSELDKCIASLRSKASDYYSRDGWKREGKTSPFDQSDASGSTPSTAASDESSSASAPVQAWTEWRFERVEEEGSNICFAETEVGDVKVGFMARPGGDVDGYVAGTFSGQTTTTWTVDNKAPHILDGDQDAYFGWHSFEEVSEALVADVAVGNELRIAKLGEKHLVVPLQGAQQALLSFAECVSKPKPAPDAAGLQTDPQPASKGDRLCLLEVKGEKVIDGACSWEPYGSSGPAFQMSANGYFAILKLEDADNAV